LIGGGARGGRLNSSEKAGAASMRKPPDLDIISTMGQVDEDVGLDQILKLDGALTQNHIKPLYTLQRHCNKHAQRPNTPGSILRCQP